MVSSQTQQQLYSHGAEPKPVSQRKAKVSRPGSLCCPGGTPSAPVGGAMAATCPDPTQSRSSTKDSQIFFLATPSLPKRRCAQPVEKSHLSQQSGAEYSIRMGLLLVLLLYLCSTTMLLHLDLAC